MLKKTFFILLFSFLIIFTFTETSKAEYTNIEGDVYFDGILLDFVDADTFLNLNDNFSKDKNFCVYKNEKISFCRIKSFEALGGEYAKDENYVFYGKDKIEGAEVKTFSFIGDDYARDRSQVFYKGQFSSGIKSDSFVLIGFGYAKDSDNVYYDNEIISGIDQNTVEVISDNYLRDSKNVYFNGEVVLDADPATFNLMSEGYAMDKSYYFHNGKAVAKITNRLYERYKQKDLSDTCVIDNFLYDIEEVGVEINDNFKVYEKCVAYNGVLINQSHGDTFEVINEKLSKDKNFVYFIYSEELKRIPFSHSQSFKELDASYYRDNYAVYYGEEFQEVGGANAEAFKVVCTLDSCKYEAEDGERFFLEGIEVGVDDTTKQIIGEAKMIFSSYKDLNSLLSYNSLKRDLAGEIEIRDKFLGDLTSRVYGIEETDKQAVLNFIMYGTQMTRALGAGERAGVVNSYKTAFGKLPTSSQEWTDVIKIANGRWPTERNEVAEERAERRFRYIYHRTPLSMDPHDNAAITIMAYGLRTAKRNQASEKAAIITFRGMFLEYPVSSSDWDMVRAIAYSGASR